MGTVIMYEAGGGVELFIRDMLPGTTLTTNLSQRVVTTDVSEADPV